MQKERDFPQAQRRVPDVLREATSHVVDLAPDTHPQLAEIKDVSAYLAGDRIAANRSRPWELLRKFLASYPTPAKAYALQTLECPGLLGCEHRGEISRQGTGVTAWFGPPPGGSCRPHPRES